MRWAGAVGNGFTGADVAGVGDLGTSGIVWTFIG